MFGLIYFEMSGFIKFLKIIIECYYSRAFGNMGKDVINHVQSSFYVFLLMWSELCSKIRSKHLSKELILESYY